MIILAPMDAGIAHPRTSTAALDAPRATSDEQMIELWLHGRSVHTQRAYRADINQFRLVAGKPFQQGINGSA
ncbi:MAG TPA: hypothetical protein VG675_24645 [Bryobacteraceae bacterium]|nr:hypothetical protein [Bryobacteraceae bacterium]